MRALVHPNADAIAGDSRLRHFEQGAADPIMIANTYRIVSQSFDGEILAKLAVNEVRPPQPPLPIAVRLDLVRRKQARCSPPWPARSPWPSPSTFNRRTRQRPGTGLFQIPVCTVRPRHWISRGSPTFTDSRRAMPIAYATSTPSRSDYPPYFTSAVQLPIGWLCSCQKSSLAASACRDSCRATSTVTVAM